jgi:hypothetical protein
MRKHVADELRRNRYPSRGDELSTMNHYPVRDTEARADKTQGKSRIDHDQIRTDIGRKIPRCANEVWCGQEHCRIHPLDAVSPLTLLVVEPSRIGMGRGGQDGKGIRS